MLRPRFKITICDLEAVTREPFEIRDCDLESESSSQVRGGNFFLISVYLLSSMAAEGRVRGGQGL